MSRPKKDDSPNAKKPGAAPIRHNFRLAAVQIVAIVLIVLSGLIFLTNQGQQPDVTFGGGPKSVGVGQAVDVPAPPTYEQIESQYAGQKIARLPGAIANFDEQAVLEAMAKTDVKQIVVAPPRNPDGGDPIDVPDDVLLITGLSASLSPYSTYSSRFESYAAAFARNDVTSPVLALLVARADPDAEGPDDAPLTWREPTADEAAQAVADAQDDAIAFVEGVSPFEISTDALQSAFPDTSPVVVVAPVPEPGQPPVDYAATLKQAFPGRPLVMMTGLWIRYDGADTAADRDAVAASFYGQLESRLSEYSYSQEQVLRASLNRVEQFRYSEIFSRKVPYVPPDPVGVTLPFLPWLCAGLGVICVGASLRSTGRPRPVTEPLVTGEQLSTYAGLSELAVEVNPLALGKVASMSATRALAALNEAGELVDDPTASEVDLQTLLARAETDLQKLADAIKRPEYRPATFLEGRWS